LTRKSSKRAALVLAALGVVFAGAGSSLAAAPITVSSTCCTYSTATFSIDQGEVASFSNAGGDDVHNVTAAQNGPDGAPLFFSKTISPNQITAVDGTQYLSSGSYQFMCTIHQGMNATLQVGPGGTPAARPQVALKVLSPSLRSVTGSGKLKVKVTATTPSTGVVVAAKKGAKTLTKSAHVDLPGGTSRTLKLALTSGGRKALGDVSRASVKALATVSFGSTATAKKTLK